MKWEELDCDGKGCKSHTFEVFGNSMMPQMNLICVECGKHHKVMVMGSWGELVE